MLLDDYIAAVHQYAPLMRSGIDDPDCLAKLAAEQAELAEKVAEGDRIGAALEAADVAYYAAKAVVNEQMERHQAMPVLAHSCTEARVTMHQVLALIHAKYALRTQNQCKDDAAERAAASQVLAETQESADASLMQPWVKPNY